MSTTGLLELRQLDELRLPPDLDGSDGRYRHHGSENQLGVEDDVGAVRLFLAEYDASPATKRCYQKELERLLLWAVWERGKPLSSLDREDFAQYTAFLAAPSAAWCGPKRGRGGRRYQAGWRPFVGPLSDSAQRTALRIVNSLLTYLVQARYLTGNALGLIRQRERIKGGPAVPHRDVGERCFSNSEWQALLATLDAQQEESEDDRAAAARSRFWVALLHFLALRIGEAATHRMGDFRQRRGRWLFYVTGKGQKEAQIPVGSELLEALRTYRAHLGLSPLPSPDEDRPLLLDLAGKTSVTARRANQVLKRLISLAAERLPDDDPTLPEHMRRASAHWFRHTALTRQWEKGIPLPHIKANARHARLDTTLLYVHSEEEARHQEIEKHTWR